MTRSSLRPGPRAGLEIAEARQWRIEVRSGGGVVMTAPGEPETIVASPGDVARAVVLRGAQVPATAAGPAGFEESLALLSDDAALLVVPLHLLAHGDVRDAAELRRVSGADDIAQSLGLALEPATDADAALAARSALLVDRGPVRSSLRRAATLQVALLVVAAAAAVAAMAVGGGAGPYIGLVAAVVVLFLSVEQLRYRTAFLALVDSTPPGGGRVEVPHRASAGHLQIGPDDIVHAAGGTETWVAGPRHGGVVRCDVVGGTLRFVDRHDAELLVLDASDWASDDDHAALEQACGQAGIEMTASRGGFSRGTGQPHSGVSMTATASGDLVTAGPFAALLIAFFLAVTHAAPADDLDPIRIVVVLVALAALALSGVAQLRLRQWSRRQTRTRG